MNKYALGHIFLNDEEIKAYKAIEDTLINKLTSCSLEYNLMKLDLGQIVSMVIGDNPSIININSGRISKTISLFSSRLNFNTCIEKRELVEFEEKLKSKVEEIIWQIDKNSKTDKEILLGITEYLQDNVVYDKDEANSLTSSIGINPNAHTAYGALIEGKAVCEGIARAVALLAHNLGFRCMVVNGIGRQNNSDYDERHAWNIIEYKGKFYHVDATWDINAYEVTKRYSYAYFGLDDSEIAINHDWNINYAPVCNSNELSYYIDKNLFANSEGQIEDICIREIKKGNKTIRIKVSDKVAVKGELQKYISKRLLDRLSRLGEKASISYTWDEDMLCFDAIIEE